jgi:rhodanese-related sulfurtransferase
VRLNGLYIMKNISLETLAQWQTEGTNFQLIDVRSEEEHEAHHIGGLLIPLDELLRRSKEIELDKAVVFYCRKGIRSQIAIQRLEEKFPKADFYNLEGGIGL